MRRYRFPNGESLFMPTPRAAKIIVSHFTHFSPPLFPKTKFSHSKDQIKGPAPGGMPMPTPAPESTEMLKSDAPTETNQIKRKGAAIEAATPTTAAASAAVVAGVSPSAATDVAADGAAAGVAGTTSAPALPAAGPATVPRGARPGYRVPVKRGAAVP